MCEGGGRPALTVRRLLPLRRDGFSLWETMGEYVADAAIRKMIEAGQAPRKSRVAIFGLTFKENCPDIRNSKVNDAIRRLESYGVAPIVVDPWASAVETRKEYGVELVPIEEVANVDCVIVAVAHDAFREIGLSRIKEMFRACPDGEKVLIDVKGIFSISDLRASGMLWWRL